MSDKQLAETAGIAEVLAAHRYRDVLGDYEIAPYYKHFGCSCGWEQNIAGMSGWRSWVAAHEAHVAEALSEAMSEAVRSYLRLYLLPANVASYLDPWDTHSRVAERCAPLLVEHVFPPDRGDRP